MNALWELLSEITQCHLCLILFIQSPDHIQEKGNQIPTLDGKTIKELADKFERSTAEVKSCLKVRTFENGAASQHITVITHFVVFFFLCGILFRPKLVSWDFFRGRVMTT